MLVKGHCKVQDCEYKVDVETMSTSTLENPNSFLYGRIDCQYASFGGTCNGKCSILEQNGIKQG